MGGLLRMGVWPVFRRRDSTDMMMGTWFPWMGVEPGGRWDRLFTGTRMMGPPPGRQLKGGSTMFCGVIGAVVVKVLVPVEDAA